MNWPSSRRAHPRRSLAEIGAPCRLLMRGLSPGEQTASTRCVATAFQLKSTSTRQDGNGKSVYIAANQSRPEPGKVPPGWLFPCLAGHARPGSGFMRRTARAFRAADELIRWQPFPFGVVSGTYHPSAWLVRRQYVDDDLPQMRRELWLKRQQA